MCVDPQWIVPVPNGTYRFVGRNIIDFRPVIDIETGELFEPFQIGCGKCLECIDLHKLQWTHRLLDELKCHDKSSFVTLTYRSGTGFDNNLHKEHLRKFIKDLRNNLRVEKIKIRFFNCGEYGSRGRPHYHCAIFGYDFPDKVPFKIDKKGFMMSRSSFLERIWPYGFSSILPCCEATFHYITKDMQKLRPLEHGRLKPFLSMSTHPGIGANGWSRKLTDGRVWHDGHSVNLPRYYKKIAEREGLDLSSVRRNDVLFAENRSKIVDFSQKSKKVKKRLDKLNKM